MEKTIKNYKLTLILVLISYILMVVFNFLNFFNGNILNILYGILAILLIIMMFLSIKMIDEVIENSVKIAKIIAPVVLFLSLADSFFLAGNSPFKYFRIVGLIQLVGSIEILIKADKISQSID